MSENFADLLAESFNEDMNIEGSVVLELSFQSKKRPSLLMSVNQVDDEGIYGTGQMSRKYDQVEAYVERLEDRNGQVLKP